jgi:hypothetical protein
MKMKNLIAFVAGVVVVTLVQVASAQSADKRAATPSTPENWVLLDSHVVDYTLDRDVIKLKDSTSVFTVLKFKVNNGPINLHKATVDFADGEDQDLSFATDASGARVIDLHGNNRKIDKIVFWYDTKNSSDKKAVVEVWGKK